MQTAVLSTIKEQSKTCKFMEYALYVTIMKGNSHWS